jgi:hypothetical protein
VEVIVVDNGSKDGSKEMLRQLAKNLSRLTVIDNDTNVGYPKGNNRALKEAKGEYVLFLNSDVIVDGLNLEETLSYMDKHPKIGVLTVKVVLPNGKIDPASHRGFPDLWNSFCYFAKLERLLGWLPVMGKIFGGYHLTHLDLTSIHEIDSPTGAFFLTRKRILDRLGGFDESFFMYGEDLDLAYRIKEIGYQVVYYPLSHVTHLKYVSGLNKGCTETRKRTREYFYQAMKIFYRKHYQKKYPSFINQAVYSLISLKQQLK